MKSLRIAIFILFFSFSFQTHAQEVTPRLEQLTKTHVNGGTSGLTSQALACADVAGHIEEVSLSLHGTSDVRLYFSKTQFGTGQYASDVVTLTSNLQQEYSFNFPIPVDVTNELCGNGETMFYMVIDTITPQSSVKVYGSPSPDAYRDSEFGCRISNLVRDHCDLNGNVAVWDMYFIINTNASSNTEPVITPIGNQTISESATLQLTLTATDPDITDTHTYSATNLPTGATLDANTGVFSWTPDYDDAGTYDVTFTVTDNGDPVASDSETITITVENTNRAPVLASIGNQTVNEGSTLSFVVSATDPDGDTLTYSAANLPTGASFNPSTQTFSWTPGYSNEGNYTDVEFTVTDNGSPMELAVELITITVGNVNRAPELSNPGPQEILENNPLSFTLSATDPDGDTISIIATNLPTGASFNGTTFTWTPSLSQEGTYTVSFTATDNGTPNESVLVEVVITVGDNPTPVEQAENLIDTVVDFDLPQNVENSYLANLQKVSQFITDGKIQAALNQLDAFIQKVEQDYQQGKITQSEYNMLIDMAEGLIEDLGG